MREVYKGIVRGGLIELEDDIVLPEGIRVRVIPEETAVEGFTLREWLQEARQLRAQFPMTSDSVEILRHLRSALIDEKSLNDASGCS